MKKPPKELTRKPGAMTERTCKCGCGRALRVNNTSGWSGYCNSRKVAGGERAERPSRAKSLEEIAQRRKEQVVGPTSGQYRLPAGYLHDLELARVLDLRAAVERELQSRREAAAKTLQALDQAIAKRAAA